MIPYNYKAELVMLKIVKHSNKKTEIIAGLKGAKKEFRKLKKVEEYYLKR